MKLDIFDIDKFIEANGCKQVTSRFYIGPDGTPADDGLFSTSIFGKMGSEERKHKFGYFDLRRKFFHPLVYNVIYNMFRALPAIIAGEKFCRLDAGGNIIVSAEPKDGYETGLDFFVRNWSKIRWTKVGEDNASREKKENLLGMLGPKEVFVEKFLAIPAFYRDVNFQTATSTGQKITVDGLNALYIKLLSATTSETITFTNAFLTQSNVQRTLNEIYSELTKKVSGKTGVIRQSVMGKSVDYSTIAVLSCPRMEAIDPRSQQVGFNEMGIPLPLCMTLFYPFVLKHLEDVFHEYEHNYSIVIDGDKRFDIERIVHKSITTEVLKSIVDGFIKDKTRGMRTRSFWIEGFDGKETKLEKVFRGRVFPDRPYTLTDLFFEICADVVQNKHVIATRYPVTGPESVITCRVKLLTTEKTIDVSMPYEQGGLNLKFGRNYPYFPTDGKGNVLPDKIRWIDTAVPNVSFLKGLGGDFDGQILFKLSVLF